MPLAIRFNAVTTDGNGEFNITGDYSCTAGQPVILIGYGGYPSYIGQGTGSTPTTQTNTFPIASVTVSNLSGQGPGTGTATYTFNLGGTNPGLFYPGESVVLSGVSINANSGGSPTFLDGQTLIVTGTGLTTTSFQTTFTGDYGGYPTSTSPYYPAGTTVQSAGATVTATPSFNPAAVNMAVLGICPAAQTVATITGAPQGTSSYQLSGISASDIAKLAVGDKILGSGVGPGNVATTITAINSATGTITMAALDTGPGAPPYTTSYSYTISASTFGPSSSNPIKYVYMNEISTAAAAYAMNQYLPWGTNDQSGNDEFHIGSPNNTQALQGIANAANTAGLLYDITGGNIGTIPDGDVHIARSVTPNGGNGTVPQAGLDAVGNILAACVDSANTYRLGTGTTSGQCNTLFQQAEDNGYVDTSASTHQAFNTAQAAFNLAHYPQSLGTATTACACYGGAQTYTAGTASTASTWATKLFNIPTGNIPFNPTLGGVPNDFAIAIQWSDASANGGTAVGYNDVQVDSNGNVWTANPTGTTSQAFEFPVTNTTAGTTVGSVVGYTAALSLLNGAQSQLAIDTSNNAWLTAVSGTYKFTAGTAAGTLIGGAAGNIVVGGGIAVDATASQYVVNNANTGLASVGAQTSAGAAITNFPTTAAYATCGNYTRYITLDSSGSIWTADANAIFNTFTYICRYNKTGGAYVYSLLMPSNSVSGAFSLPHFLATDATDNLIFAEKNLSQLYKITAGTTTANAGSTNVTTSTTNPIGVVIDGANTVWISNQSANGSGTGGIVQYSDALTRITSSYLLGAGVTANALGPIAADPSGNIWTSGGTVLYEYVGVATPTVTPLALAKSLKTTGTKP